MLNEKRKALFDLLLPKNARILVLPLPGTRHLVIRLEARGATTSVAFGEVRGERETPLHQNVSVIAELF